MNNIETTVDADQLYWLKILLIMDMGYELTQSSLEKIEKLQLSLKYIQELINTAAKRGYSQVYLIALKKKEELNGFTPIQNEERLKL